MIATGRVGRVIPRILERRIKIIASIVGSKNLRDLTASLTKKASYFDNYGRPQGWSAGRFARIVKVRVPSETMLTFGRLVPRARSPYTPARICGSSLPGGKFALRRNLRFNERRRPNPGRCAVLCTFPLCIAYHAEYGQPHEVGGPNP